MTIDDVAFVVDDEWNVEFTNDTILNYVDVPLEALEDQPVMRLAEEFIADNTDYERFEQALKRMFQREGENGSPERVELALDVDGENPIFEYQLPPLVSNGETTAAVVTTRDITEHKRRERQLKRQTERFDNWRVPSPTTYRRRLRRPTGGPSWRSKPVPSKWSRR